MTEEDDEIYGEDFDYETLPIEYYLNNKTEPNMKEVHDLITELQARLKNCGGGEIIITNKDFTIKLTGNARCD